jgi:hypothetical protein
MQKVAIGYAASRSRFGTLGDGVPVRVWSPAPRPTRSVRGIGAVMFDHGRQVDQLLTDRHRQVDRRGSAPNTRSDHRPHPAQRGGACLRVVRRRAGRARPALPQGFPRPGHTHGGVVVVDGGNPPALRGHSPRIRHARTSRNSAPPVTRLGPAIGRTRWYSRIALGGIRESHGFGSARERVAVRWAGPAAIPADEHNERRVPQLVWINRLRLDDDTEPISGDP